MTQKLSPEDLQNQSEFELLTEVSHQNLKEFILNQVHAKSSVIKAYSFYQILMLTVFVFIFTQSLISAFKGQYLYIVGIGLGFLFSFSLLIIIHELLHALAYLLTGARNISFGVILKKFVFYALADRQVISSKPFHFIALAPLVGVKITCLIGVLIFCNEKLIYFFICVMCLHSLFCAGDIAMLAFYKLQNGKEIYNFDDRKEGKTYFYIRKSVL